jgi:hypothetical protein
MAKEKKNKKEPVTPLTISNSVKSFNDLGSEDLNKTQIVDKPPFLLNPGEYIEIKISNENPEAMKLVLEFLYTDRIMSLEGRENELETVKLIVDVYKIANQFIITKLKRICESFFDSSITCSNVLNLLRYVDQLNLATLKDFCMKFLIKDTNYQQVVMSSDFEQINAPLIVEIVRQKQAPRKYTNSEQINDIIAEQSKNFSFLLSLSWIRFKLDLIF